MGKREDGTDLKRIAELFEKASGKPVPGSLLSLITGNLRYMECFHPADFPSEGGLFFIDEGGVDVFVRSSSAQGWGQPNFVDSLTGGRMFCLCPAEDTASRILTYAPVTSVTGYLLWWDDLTAMLMDGGQAGELITHLVIKANSSLLKAVAAAALQIPEGWGQPLPKVPAAGNGLDVLGQDLQSSAPTKLAPGEIWNDAEAAGVFIEKGSVCIGETQKNRMFCARGAGIQAVCGDLFLKAESETVIYPLSLKRILPAGKVVIELACSAQALTNPLVSVLDAVRESTFTDYLKRARHKEREGRDKAVAELSGIQRGKKRMTLIPANDAEGAWDSVVQMIAVSEGKQPLSKFIRGKTSGVSKDPVSARASCYGMRSRVVSIHSGDLSRIRVPVIAVRKDETPIVLEPAGKYVWVHNPLKGSYKADSGEIERELPGLAYELIPEFGKGLAKPRNITSFALSGFSGYLRRVIWTSIFIGAFGILIPIATNWIFSFAIPSAQMNVLNSIGLALLVSALAVGLLSMFRAMILISLEMHATSRISSALWSHLFRLPVRFFRKYRVGDLSLRMQAMDLIRQQLTSSVISIGVNGLFSLIYIGVMFYYSVKLALYGIGAGCLASIIFLAGLKIISKRQRKMLSRKADEQSLLQEMIRGILTVRTSSAVRRIYSRWLRLIVSEMGVVYTSDTATMWTTNLLLGIPTLGTLIMYWIGGDDIIAGKIPLSVFIAFNAAFSPFINAVIMACQTGMNLTSVGPLWERVRPIFEAEEERSGGGVDPGELEGRIEISSCTFRYDEKGREIVRDVSLTINPGECVAITGPSGSGKTTLIRLLLGFEEPSGGQVFYDGHDLHDLDPQAIRRQIGVVLQRSELIRGSIKDNLRVNAPLAAQEEIEEAAKGADIHKDIMAMPMRYETMVSEGGATFSGGQRQRLAIARALVAKPRILFFDEATSSLDNISQDRVENSIEKLKATRIIVAHRLSTIEKADRIIVLDRGRIVQEGSFGELMDKEGLFREMVKQQQL